MRSKNCGLLLTRILLVFFCLRPALAFAQEPSRKNNAEILQELERMRARIQELEAQLKTRDDVQGAKAAVQPGTVQTPVTESSAAQTAEKKADPEEPFAFADWTWLTGNPRTKASPLDTKYFTPEI